MVTPSSDRNSNDVLRNICFFLFVVFTAIRARTKIIELKHTAIKNRWWCRMVCCENGGDKNNKERTGNKESRVCYTRTVYNNNNIKTNLEEIEIEIDRK